MILLDVSVCLTGFWAGHAHHAKTRAWLDTAPDGSLGICRVVQLGWLRHLTNPVILGKDTLTRADAWNFVAQVLSDARFEWVEEPEHIDIEFAKLSAQNDRSYKLWTDDYLAAIAISGGLSLASLDARMARRHPGLTVIEPS